MSELFQELYWICVVCFVDGTSLCHFSGQAPNDGVGSHDYV